MTSNSAPVGALFLFLSSLHPRELMRLGHALVQHSTASAADQVLQAVSEHTVLFESHQCFTVLPAYTDVCAAAVLALLHRKLLCHNDFLRFCIFANTQ